MTAHYHALLLDHARTLAACLLACLLPCAAAQSAIDFQRDVRPLLSDRCFACHGPDAAERQANLRLDRASGSEGAYRVLDGVAAIVPGDPAASELWRRLTTDDLDDAMPPADSHKQRLDESQLALVRQWIEAGARYETHWAFRAAAAPAVPQVADTAWGQGAIDRLVLASLRDKGMQPSPRADRRTLIRRVTLDLTGLPPSREEVRAFLADEGEASYARLVDRLLQRPQYGEQRARYWLDLVRFADTNGMHHDHYRDMTPYRDWVIRAYNDNLPFDRFVSYQVAGDLMDQESEDPRIASGFHRLHRIIDVGTALPAESHARNVIDRVAAFGTVFLGLTVECAQCHDHKYDPIRHQDFYRLAAFFNNLDAKPETGRRSGTDFRRGLQPPYIDLPSVEQRQLLQQAERELADESRRVEVLKILAVVAAEPILRELARVEIPVANKQVQARRAARDDIVLQIPAAMVMKERDQVRETHVFLRGNYDQLGEVVERGTPAFLPPLHLREAIASRLDLADWLVSEEHPLTARVAVSRLWQQFFGVGIVATSEDFGSQGSPPSQPKLLDHLAVRFVRSGWDVKDLVRDIVMSETYRQSSVATREQFQQDPDNKSLARGSRFRMDAEMIRDQILFTSGLLSPTMFGRSVKPPQPPGIWQAVTLPDSLPRIYRADVGEKARRRSIYTFWKRGLPPPQMTILNAPSRESCVARRERTNTPLQALLLLNETQYLAAARQLAVTALRQMPDDVRRLAFVYETVTSQLPDPTEQRMLQQCLLDMRELYGRDASLAEQLCDGAQAAAGSTGDGVDASELAAWTMLASLVYNLDITRTRQ